MKNNHLPLSQSHFINGNEACAEAALLAGCRFFAGYPITPSTEIAEHLAERLPEVGGIFIQMEDEIASMNAVLGAVWGGLKGMSATSGPGFSLMMENIGLAAMTETPCVVADEMVGHMSEKVVIPPIEKLEIYPRRYTLKPPGEYKVYQRAENGVPEMVKAGDGYRIHVTGTTHDERGSAFINVETQKELIPRLVDKIRKNHKELIDTKEFFTEDAEVVLVGYGITARTLRWVAHLAREKNLKVGVLKLNIVWPFPDEVVLNLAKKVKALVVCEINMGQMVREVERAAKGFCEVKFMGHPGGGMHSPTDTLEAVQQVKA